MKSCLLLFVTISISLMPDFGESNPLSEYFEKLKKETSKLSYEERKTRMNKELKDILKQINRYLGITEPTTTTTLSTSSALYQADCDTEGYGYDLYRPGDVMPRFRKLNSDKEMEDVYNNSVAQRTKRSAGMDAEAFAAMNKEKNLRAMLSLPNSLPNRNSIIFIGSELLDYKLATRYCLSKKATVFIPQSKEDHDTIVGLIAKLTPLRDVEKVWYHVKGRGEWKTLENFEKAYYGKKIFQQDRKHLPKLCYMITIKESEYVLIPTHCTKKALPVCLKSM